MFEELYEAFVATLWYEGYDVPVRKMLEKLKDADSQIPYSEGNGFSEEIWSIFVLMFGEYGTSPRYGWIDKKTEFKKFLEKLLLDMTEGA